MRRRPSDARVPAVDIRRISKARSVWLDSQIDDVDRNGLSQGHTLFRPTIAEAGPRGAMQPLKKMIGVFNPHAASAKGTPCARKIALMRRVVQIDSHAVGGWGKPVLIDPSNPKPKPRTGNFTLVRPLQMARNAPAKRHPQASKL